MLTTDTYLSQPEENITLSMGGFGNRLVFGDLPIETKDRLLYVGRSHLLSNAEASLARTALESIIGHADELPTFEIVASANGGHICREGFVENKDLDVLVGAADEDESLRTSIDTESLVYLAVGLGMIGDRESSRELVHASLRGSLPLTKFGETLTRAHQVPSFWRDRIIDKALGLASGLGLSLESIPISPTKKLLHVTSNSKGTKTDPDKPGAYYLYLLGDREY